MKNMLATQSFSITSMMLCAVGPTIAEMEGLRITDPEKYAQLPGIIAQGVREGGEQEEFWRTLAVCFGVAVPPLAPKAVQFVDVRGAP